MNAKLMGAVTKTWKLFFGVGLLTELALAVAADGTANKLGNRGSMQLLIATISADKGDTDGLGHLELSVYRGLRWWAIALHRAISLERRVTTHILWLCSINLCLSVGTLYIRSDCFLNISYLIKVIYFRKNELFERYCSYFYDTMIIFHESLILQSGINLLMLLKNLDNAIFIIFA